MGGFSVPLTSLASTQSVCSSRSLALSRLYLELAGLPVPVGAVFDTHQIEDATRYFRNMSAPAVVKPAASTRGDAVSLGVGADQDFREAWSRATTTPQAKTSDDSRVLIEQLVEGIDVRAFVVGERVAAAIARVPLFCFGDGVHTLRERITQVLQSRDDHPLLGRLERPTLDRPSDSAFKLDEMSVAAQIYPLGSRVDASSGGLTVDVTSILTREVKELAVSALWAIPGAHAGGVDMLLPDVASTSGATVLHVDVESEFTNYHYPWIGRGRQVASELIEKMREKSHA